MGNKRQGCAHRGRFPASGGGNEVGGFEPGGCGADAGGLNCARSCGGEAGGRGTGVEAEEMGEVIVVACQLKAMCCIFPYSSSFSTVRSNTRWQ
jgi:hypothetical protein